LNCTVSTAWRISNSQEKIGEEEEIDFGEDSSSDEPGGGDRKRHGR
jgi:hypothetical protein